MLPREIILPYHIEDEELIEEFLNNINASNAESKSDVMHKTKIIVPERGEKKAVLKLAMDDSIKLAGTLDEKADREAERRDLQGIFRGGDDRLVHSVQHHRQRGEGVFHLDGKSEGASLRRLRNLS